MLGIWAPEIRPIDEEAFLALVQSMATMGQSPFSPELIDLLSGISRDILRNPITRAVPKYVALGYWMRGSALKMLVQNERAGLAVTEVLAPRGLALHLPPTNVDTIFAYSWALSVLAGNANIVRLPDTMSTNARALVTVITKALQDSGLQDTQLFCTYPYGGEIERQLASNLDLRIVWGGDAKVEAVSRTPIRPDGLSIGFPDRQSLAIISIDAYRSADSSVRDTLATKFFNDAYWFDQMGCSSPRLLVWVGEEDDAPANFYRRLESVIAAKRYEVETAVAVRKLALSNDLLAEGMATSAVRFSNELYVAQFDDPAPALNRAYGGGFFGQTSVSSLTDVAQFITRKIQTITHFGVELAQLTSLANLIAARGGYRIVPIGQALQFETVWDGVPLLSHMTRRIVVREQ